MSLHLQRQPVHALAHVGVAGGQPDPCPAREGDHRPRRARSAAATVAGSAAPEIRTRSPPCSSISISPGRVGGSSEASVTPPTGGGVEGTSATAAKPGATGAAAGAARSTRNRLRQVKSWLVLTP